MIYDQLYDFRNINCVLVLGENEAEVIIAEG